MRRPAMAALAFVAALSLGAGVAADAPSRTPLADRRPPDQTYLTFPEWFLVHSPNEYARYTAHHSPSGFPFAAHIGQLWSSYADVTRATSRYDFNAGYHFMILVIATSTTVEYGIRGLYENLVGRLAEATQTHGTTPEERFGAQVAQEYVDFINVRPWYEFDFVHALVRLWRDTPATGPDMIRKWERRYALTTEYLVKAAYGWLIGFGTAASYDPALPTTAVVIRDLPDSVPDGVELEVQRRFDDGAVLATLPRYEAFGRQATLLAAEGARFEEIAGNRDRILVSAIVPRGWSASSERRVLFAQPIHTRLSEERVVLEVTVPELAATLVELRDAPHVELEHVYDF